MEHYERLMGDVHVAVVARAAWERLPKKDQHPAAAFSPRARLPLAAQLQPLMPFLHRPSFLTVENSL